MLFVLAAVACLVGVLSIRSGGSPAGSPASSPHVSRETAIATARGYVDSHATLISAYLQRYGDTGLFVVAGQPNPPQDRPVWVVEFSDFVPVVYANRSGTDDLMTTEPRGTRVFIDAVTGECLETGP
jgi:hypothetical protein